MKKMMMIMMTMLLFLSACGKESDDKTIQLMTWGGDFIPREMIEDFEKETGMKVNYKEVSSNEEMQSLLETSGDQYDLAVVTDYMVDILRQNGTIQKLDQNKLNHLENIHEVYKGNYFDPKDEYSIPYAVSTAVLLVDPKAVSEKGAQPITSFEDLWQDELKDSIVMIDGAVEVMGIVSKALGYDVNQDDPKVLEEVKEKLFALRDHIVRFETNTPEDSVLNGEAAVGFMYSNQAAKAIAQKPELEAVFPEEGFPIYIDAFVMSEKAPNPEGAYLFLDYLMTGEVSAKISEKTQFTNVNKHALQFLSNDFKTNPLLNLSEEHAQNTFFYTDVEKVLSIYDDIYAEFKMQ